MAEATFRSGNPVLVDYTPGSAVAAGEILSLGKLTCIAHSAIVSGEQGALGAGGGVYDGTADAAIAIGDKVYFDPATAKVTEAAHANNDMLGWAVTASSADGDTIRFIHQPDGTSSA